MSNSRPDTNKPAIRTDLPPALIEAGRKIFAGEADFTWATAKLDALPPMKVMEVAFAGRSNVGKSSLVNALTNRNALARTSHTPGRTQELIFFDIGGWLTLVDMPGYGYAAVEKAKVASWNRLIHDYLRGRTNLARGTGYQVIQGTKPLTLSYGLTDSPMGLAAWIIEKFHDWTDRLGGVDPVLAFDPLIANIMMHWLPGPGPATWMYQFLVDGSAMYLPEGGRVEVPTGICSFPNDIGPPPPDSLIRRSFNMTHRTIASAGGHFPGLERGQELVADLRTFFAAYR